VALSARGCSAPRESARPSYSRRWPGDGPPARRLRMRVGDTCQAHWCAGGSQTYADHTQRSRRAESGRALSGCAARGALRIAAGAQRHRSASLLCARGWCGPPRALGARRRTAQPENRPPRFIRVVFGPCDPRPGEATAGASVRLADVVLTST